MADDQAPKIHVDDDWKAQARAEKEKLAQSQANAAAAKAGTGKKAPTGTGTEAAAAAAGQRGLPPANFQTLVSTMATQALYAMGGFPDPRTGQRTQNLELARHHIDMLGVIEEKTKGNLSEDETDLLATTIYELRSRYISMATAARQM